jgi:hypothetical protein
MQKDLNSMVFTGIETSSAREWRGLPMLILGQFGLRFLLY